jgi:single-strand DNA-binding protein
LNSSVARRDFVVKAQHMTTDLEFTAPGSPAPGPDEKAAPVAARNEVAIGGLLAEAGEERELAGGALAVRWTLRVPREGGGSDLIDCVALDPALRQQALGWPQGAPLEVWGAIRRRFFRAGGRTTTRVEVEAFRAVEGDLPSSADQEVSRPER